MQKSGRIVARLFAGIVACGWLPGVNALAQNYPVKPIRILVGYGPGGATDITARIVAQKLSENLRQSVIVENRPGATGSIAIQAVVTAPADGYTLLMISASDAVVPAMRASLPYDFERDLAPVSLITSSPYVLVVHPSVPVRNFKQFLALAKSGPGRLNNGSSGIGSLAHLFGELINVMADVKIVHVPYKGALEAANAVASGQIEMSFPSITGALPLLQVGKLREIAVTSGKRTSLMPALPTISESGLPGYDRSGWYGMLASARVPKEVIAQLNAEIVKVVHTPELKSALNKQGLEPQTNRPDEFAAFIRNEIEQNVKLVKLAGVKAE